MLSGCRNPTENTQTSNSEHTEASSPPRRKKATRACFHCQKAHLTCDDSRPCQRCIKRDLASTCADGIRKKAKYLQDPNYDAYIPPQTNSDQSPEQHLQFQIHLQRQQYQRQQMISAYLNPSSMPLQSPQMPNQTHVTPHQSLDSTHRHSSMRPIPPPLQLHSLPPLSFNSLTTPLPSTPPSTPLSTSSSSPVMTYNPAQIMNHPFFMGAFDPNTVVPSSATSQNVYMHSGFQQNPNNLADPIIYYPLTTANYGFGSEAVTMEYSMLNHMLNSAPTESLIPGPANHGLKRDSSGKRKSNINTPQNVYANITKPFSYTEGFHYLVKWVRERMDKEHIERIVRAIATFRPSFIALIMNLTEEDLIFMEKCFQRTLLEFEKLISFSGTPTVVWRRTGQIALVGKEFSLLTQWSRDQLLGKAMYIYEVMDSQSAVEYWEKFAAHAFDNCTPSVMTTCILLSPQGRQVPCTFCFTIKRDLFDIPLAIVGNFLPILS
ncbi:8378_t:CDS:10 [Ambispora leptoticha]|uniref:8378_t:CDS:1 n=1 Tax=Ambispora leptoticha TaxID=144679 RepID=A0A9N8ZQJ9_9GLOM|nr:8378_t:CDS:10 [Ambispora leptoticha]